VWRVLLGEDNRDAAETLAELLEHWGHRVRVAFDGRGALAAGPESRLEVVLLDLGLPGMTDYEVASHLRAGEVGAPRVVALTGYGDRDSRRRVPEAEFDHHLTKPATEWIHPCSLPSCSICLSQVRVRV
jgi:CheY-like chemotaxis protein